MKDSNQRRWKGQLPKVGIRPVIDGRRKGVRESLEDQTMGLAKAAAKLISENLRYPNGKPVECVIADTCIGGVAEAAMAADKFAREGVGVSLSVTPCWCYGSETMDMDPFMPKAVWGFNGSERPGAVYLAAVLAAHNQKGLPAFGIYGRDVQDAADNTIPSDVAEKILRFVRAGLATAILRGKSYLSLGSVSMGIAGSMVNEDLFQCYLGMRNEYVDMSEFIRRIEMGIYDQDEYARALAWVKANCQEGPDLNPPEWRASREQKEKDWEFVVKMAMIARDLMTQSKLDEMDMAKKPWGATLCCRIPGAAAGLFQRRHGPSSIVLDWNGIRQPLIMATENDTLNGICAMFGHLLTNTAQVSPCHTY